jgi:hypothetical protein
MEQKVGGQTAVTIKMDKIELNPTIDKTLFTFPDDLKTESAKKN